MMHAGRIIFEAGGAEKAALTVDALVAGSMTRAGPTWSMTVCCWRRDAAQQ